MGIAEALRKSVVSWRRKRFGSSHVFSAWFVQFRILT